ncbi:UNKNOWN [Stylonychia lemnae]|uniref:C2H2-type domain-containing protein n=1 Tax=Stylonychia lemnae TaxID=5949 RepID=A0A078AG13_STYLE|nr:UNKNOWN [Stylonychia lemnae]|eukprot:CDW81250.1 UNKNOWN [Stylonychia lemnae]
MLGIEEQYIIGFKPIDMENDPIKFEEKKKNQPKKQKKEVQESEDEDYDSEDEEGQLQIPKDVVRQVEDLQEDLFYLVCYLRQKTEEEIEIEQKVGYFLYSIIIQKQRIELEIDDEKSHLKIKPEKGASKYMLCPFIQCLKEFSETGNLKTHMRTHTGERPFVCTFEGCQKEFITKGHLKTHELIHSGDRPYACEKCDKSYSRSGRLKIHMRTHTGEKPFICPFDKCDKTFTEKGNLKTHIRIHSGEKPYLCSFQDCDKSFTTQGHLTDHMRRHSGERPFKCTKCDMAFMRSSTLKIHLRRHNGEKPFQCEGIDEIFDDEDSEPNYLPLNSNENHKIQLNRRASSQLDLTFCQEISKGFKKVTEKKLKNKLAKQQENFENTPKFQGNNESKKKRIIKNEDKAKIKSQKEIKVDSPIMKEAEKIEFKLDKSFQQIHKNLVQQNFEKQQYQMQQQSELNQSQQSSEISQLGLQSQLKFINNNSTSTSQQNFSINYQTQQPQNCISIGNIGQATFNIPIAINVFPQQLGMKSATSSKQPSFQNLFASLQQNQQGYTASKFQPSNSSNNNNNNNNNNGVQSPQRAGSQHNLYSFQQSPQGKTQFQSDPNASNYSPDSNQKVIMKHHQQSQPVQPGFQITHPKQHLEKWKNFGSFSSITSLNELIMNNKSFGLPTIGNTFQNQYNFSCDSRPMSKQGSAHNLYSMQIQNMNKNNMMGQNSDMKGFVKFHDSGMNLGEASLNQQVMNAGNFGSTIADSEALRQLQKTHSLTNLFSSNQKQVPLFPSEIDQNNRPK